MSPRVGKGGKPQASEVTTPPPQDGQDGQTGTVDTAQVDRLTQAVADQKDLTGGSDASGGKQQSGAGLNGKKKSKGKGGKPQASEVTTPPPQDGQSGTVDTAQVDRLTQAVADQGNKVRDLKASKADKAVIDAEVAILLSLKRDLAMAQGSDPNASVSGGKKKGKKK